MCRLGIFFGEFNYARLPNPIGNNPTIEVRLGSITERSTDYAGITLDWTDLPAADPFFLVIVPVDAAGATLSAAGLLGALLAAADLAGASPRCFSKIVITVGLEAGCKGSKSHHEQ